MTFYDFLLTNALTFMSQFTHYRRQCTYLSDCLDFKHLSNFIETSFFDRKPGHHTMYCISKLLITIHWGDFNAFVCPIIFHMYQFKIHLHFYIVVCILDCVFEGQGLKSVQ